MGLVTREMLAEGKTQFAGINQDSGEFELNNGSKCPAIKGHLLGFATHDFDFKGKMIKKLDVFLKDDALYQLQFGFYSWQTFKLINSLLNIPALAQSGILQIISGKNGDNYTIGVEWNGTYVKWKFSFEDLHLKDKEGNAKLEWRNKIIDKWFDALMLVKPYVPEVASVSNEQNGSDLPSDVIPF